MASWLQPVHVLAAVVWLASSVVLGAVGLYLRVGRRTGALPRLGRVVLYTGRGLIAPAMALVVGSGIWLVLASSEWSFSQPWVVVGLVLFVVALVGAIQVTQVATRMRHADAGPAEAANALQRRWLIGQAGLVAILVAAVLDMALKPGA